MGNLVTEETPRAAYGSPPRSEFEPREDAGTSISIVVPVVSDNTDNLTELYRTYAPPLRSTGSSFEFLFVLDGAVSAPSAELVHLARSDESVRVLSFAETFGEAAALRAGIRHSRGGIIVTLRPWFQVAPEAIRDVLDALDGGADVAVGCRTWRQDRWYRRLERRTFHQILRVIGNVRFRDTACGLRAMRRKTAQSLPLYGSAGRFLPAIAHREGFQVTEIPVSQDPRDDGRRSRGPWTYMEALLDLIAFLFLIRFTDRPLRFFGLVGCGLGLAGGLLSVYLLLERFVAGEGIANRPLLLLAVLLITVGVQVIGLGLVGEIIVSLRMPDRRPFRVKSITSARLENDGRDAIGSRGCVPRTTSGRERPESGTGRGRPT